MANDNIKIHPIKPGETINLGTLPKDARDKALGRYMDAFSRMEGAIYGATAEIFGIDHKTLYPVFAILGTRQSIDLLDSTAQAYLSREGSQKVTKLCEKLKRRNMRRNHIVHGHWQMSVLSDGQHATQQWIRRYDHASPEISKLPHTHKSNAGTFTFTVPEIDRATDHVEEALLELSSLVHDLRSLRFRPPAP